MTIKSFTIDPNLVDAMLKGSARDVAVVTALVALAQALGIKAMVQGGESTDHDQEIEEHGTTVLRQHPVEKPGRIEDVARTLLTIDPSE